MKKKIKKTWNFSSSAIICFFLLIYLHCLNSFHSYKFKKVEHGPIYKIYKQLSHLKDTNLWTKIRKNYQSIQQNNVTLISVLKHNYIVICN